MTFTAGRILNLGEVTFQPEAITNTAFIAAVGEQVRWTKEDDGTVLLTDANKQAMAEVTELNVFDKGLTDLSGIEYFTGLWSLVCSWNRLSSLDITQLENLYGELLCGEQTTDGKTSQTLTLYLTQEQYNNYWVGNWGNE